MRWKSRGFPTIGGTSPAIAPTTFKATFNPDLVHNTQQILQLLANKQKQVKKGSASNWNWVGII